MAKRVLKSLAQACSLVVVFLPAAVSGFGRWSLPYEFFAHALALGPGLPGDYLRIAYYRLTLDTCSLSSRVSFGSFFAHATARLGPDVCIGGYCIIGMAAIGAGSQIGSATQILSGARQHKRNEDGGISSSDPARFITVTVGPGCWIGAGSIVMADVGEGSTVGAGSVVTRPVPPRSVVAGSPARPI
jgi:acetyltransferase-like isoleucine patch superfamily enzyme